MTNQWERELPSKIRTLTFHFTISTNDGNAYAKSQSFKALHDIVSRSHMRNDNSIAFLPQRIS